MCRIAIAHCPLDHRVRGNGWHPTWRKDGYMSLRSHQGSCRELGPTAKELGQPAEAPLSGTRGPLRDTSR